MNPGARGSFVFLPEVSVLSSKTNGLAVAILALVLASAAPLPGPRQGDGPPAAELTDLFGENGVHLDLERGVCAVAAQIAVRDELLEYLLVNPHGAGHESLLVTGAGAEVLNAGLLALGVEPGKNAEWIPREPKPTPEEVRAGIAPFEIVLPEGDGFYLYATWREGDETYFYRIEDLIRDLGRQRSMRRHRWAFLGSRMVADHKGVESFAASLEGNLINISLFQQGNTLVTATLEECIEQTVWLPNAWLLPPRGSDVLLVLSRGRLSGLPESLEPHLLTVEVAPRADGGR